MRRAHNHRHKRDWPAGRGYPARRGLRGGSRQRATEAMQANKAPGAWAAYASSHSEQEAAEAIGNTVGVLAVLERRRAM